MLPDLLRKSVKLEANEVRATLVSFGFVFVLMAAYYILRPVRDAMASDWSDAEVSWRNRSTSARSWRGCRAPGKGRKRTVTAASAATTQARKVSCWTGTFPVAATTAVMALKKRVAKSIKREI